MSPYMLAEEKDLISLPGLLAFCLLSVFFRKDLIYLFYPDELSFLDGAQIACGYGTVYEGLTRVEVSGTGNE